MKSFLSTESGTKILQSIYFAYKVDIIGSYSNRMNDILVGCYWSVLSLSVSYVC